MVGGAVAWSVHLIAAWAVDELTCGAGRATVAGVPLVAVMWVAVIVPALVTAAALAVSALVWRRESAAARQRADRGYGRTGMLGLVGLGANALFLSIIVAGGAAVLVLPVCQP
ncbi:MAG: hypothetical protein IRY85_07055 [Micromonosporaceae bacterium]|nr:hypothetical protein [Micromonosporaceae bacterium]